MAITDSLTTFALAEALAGGGTGTEMLGDAIDITLARDIGAGHPLYLVISAATALAGTGLIQFALLTGDSDPVLTSDTKLWLSPVFDADTVAAGDVLMAMSLPIEGNAYDRYLQLAEIVTSAAVTGSINAYLTPDVQAWKAYAEGNN